MEVLYYMQPRPITGGSTNVAYFLTKALAKRVNLTYFPRVADLRYPLDLLRVYRDFLDKKFNVVHFNVTPSFIQYYRTSRWVDGNYFLLKSAKGRGASTIINIHGIITLENEKSRQKDQYVALKTLDKVKACRKIDQIVVNSEYMRSQVIACYGAEKDKIVVIPNGVDLDMFKEQNSKFTLSGDPAVLYVGHLWWVKGVDVLLQAIVELKSIFPNIKLHLVGKTDAVDYRLKAKQKGLEGQLIFHGAVPHSMIPYYFKAASLCAFPSRHEGFSIAMLEAMASGTPIVASDIERFREILRNEENGVVFKSGDAGSLSAAILRVHSSSELRRRIIQGASETVLPYAWDNIAERYLSLYNEMCS